MRLPFELKTVLGYPKEWVSIDTCIAAEIGYLWHQRVRTLNSCCGHGILPASVIVAKDSVARMKELGYELSSERCAVLEQVFLLKGTQEATT